jgi:hypothetical protein
MLPRRTSFILAKNLPSWNSSGNIWIKWSKKIWLAIPVR